MIKLPVIVFRNADGKILLQFRDSGAPTAPLMFSFFGGVTEGDEASSAAIIREVQEELGIRLTEEDLELLAEENWVGQFSENEKTVFFYECRRTITWKDIDVQEGAGAAFLTKEEIAAMDNVTDLVKHFVGTYI